MIRATRLVKKGNIVLILTDKKIHKDQFTIPAPMAVGAIHHKLIDSGLRCDTNLIVETGSARNPHHFAVLLGYGATAIYPYLSFELIFELINKNNKSDDYTKSVSNYISGINKGIFKIMSKMGISCVSSYRGAQLFETVGLDDDVVDLCFRGTINRISTGTDFDDLQKDILETHEFAWDEKLKIKTGGLLKYVHDDEYHDYNPDVVKQLQECVSTGSYDDYKKFSETINNRRPSFLRDLLNLRSKNKSVSLKQVEPISNIVKRFDTAGMSLGALSPEAHEALAVVQ